MRVLSAPNGDVDMDKPSTIATGQDSEVQNDNMGTSADASNASATCRQRSRHEVWRRAYISRILEWPPNTTTFPITHIMAAQDMAAQDMAVKAADIMKGTLAILSENSKPRYESS